MTPTVDCLAELVREAAERRPDQPFLRFEGTEFTWAQLYERACRLASVLLERAGRTRPPTLGVLADNVPETLIAAFAASLAGGALVGFDPARPSWALSHDVARARPTLLLVEPKYAPLLDDDTIEAFVAAGRLLVVDREAPAGIVEPSESLEAALLIAPADDPDMVPAPDELCLLEPGGDGDEPRSHERLVRTARDLASAQRLSPDDLVAFAAPPWTWPGLAWAVAPAALTGAKLLAVRRADPGALRRDASAATVVVWPDPASAELPVGVRLIRGV